MSRGRPLILGTPGEEICLTFTDVPRIMKGHSSVVFAKNIFYEKYPIDV